MDLKTITFEEDDQLLLCSDGLSNKVSSEVMASILAGDTPLIEKAGTLIDLANQAGGEDNITLAIITYEDCPERQVWIMLTGKRISGRYKINRDDRRRRNGECLP